MRSPPMPFPQSAHTGGCWLLLCSLLPASTPTCCCSPQTWFVVTPHTASIPTPSDFTGHTDPAGNLILCSLTPLDTVIILQTSIQIPGTRLHSCHYTCPLLTPEWTSSSFITHTPTAAILNTTRTHNPELYNLITIFQPFSCPRLGCF